MLTVVPLILNMSLAKVFLSAAVKTKFRLKSLLSSKFPIFKSFHFHFRFESVLYANGDICGCGENSSFFTFQCLVRFILFYVIFNGYLRN
jgi:hypothetical protein